MVLDGPAEGARKGNMSMAKKTEAAQAKPAFQPPKGFVSHTRREVDGFAKLEPGLTIIGKFCGDFAYDNDNGTQTVVLIELAEPCKAIDENKEEVTLEKGQVLGLNLTGSIKEMIDYVDTRCGVYAVVKGKKPLKGGKTMWDIDWSTPENVRPIKRGAVKASTVRDDDDLPF